MISKQEILNASILIVDDQQSNILLLEEMLQGAGYTRIARAVP
jgi:CheY-like chemotaxis protein